jgi:hypothetical protein
MEQGDLFCAKPTVLAGFSPRYQSWLDEVRLEGKTRKHYRNGCRLLKATPIFGMRQNEITTEDAERPNLRLGWQCQLCIANSETDASHS